MAFTEKQLRDAGIEIRERHLTRDGGVVTEYQVFDGRKIVSRHVMFADAMKAAKALLAHDR